jgi:transcriptional regulator with XRE-family HTH domain
VPRPAKHQLFSKAEAGRRIRSLRESRGRTQAELALFLGIPQSNLSDMERGVRGLTVHQAVKLAQALKVSTDDILIGKAGSNGGSERTPPTSLKLLRRLRRIEQLPTARQRVILKLLDALIEQDPGHSAS